MAGQWEHDIVCCTHWTVGIVRRSVGLRRNIRMFPNTQLYCSSRNRCHGGSSAGDYSNLHLWSE